MRVIIICMAVHMRDIGGRNLLVIIAGAALILAPVFGRAETAVYPLSIKGHKFNPSQLSIPPNIKVQIRIHNLDQTAEEFESSDLQREKVVPGGGNMTLWVGPLEPGTYSFFGDFNPSSARGQIIVK